jgi:hypothetical protein
MPQDVRCVKKMAGNSLRRWEIGIARTQDGGRLIEQMAGSPAKMAATHNVKILKKNGK